jgi:peptidase E
MTKYILHGGNAQKQNADNDKFFKEVLRDLPEAACILLVHFAAALEKVETYRERDIAQFERNKGSKQLSYLFAAESDFTSQIAQADAVYFCGGTTVRLMQSMARFANWQQLFTDKTVAGESAGANSLAKYCYSKSGGGIINGLGLVPVKLVCHYSGEHEEDLENSPENLEIVLLADYQYRVFWT